MIRLHGGPADGYEVDKGLRVIAVRIEAGEPVFLDGRLLVAAVQPSSASHWEPYVWNESAREYRYARASQDPRRWSWFARAH